MSEAGSQGSSDALDESQKEDSKMIDNNCSNTGSKRWLAVISTLLIICVSMIAVVLLAGKDSSIASFSNNIYLVSTSKNLAPVGISTPAISNSKDIIPNSKDINIIASNEYGVFNGAPYAWMTTVEGSQLAEPYKTTLLTLNGTVVDKGNKYVWGITYDNKAKFPDAYEGKLTSQTTTQNIIFKKVGTYTITIAVHNKKGDQIKSYKSRIVCK